MKSIMTKKALVIVAASLVIALVISIMPGGFLVSAAELSRAEAREIALEELKKENIIVDDEEVRVGRPTLDENDEFYTVTIKTKDNDYILKINATNKDGEVLEVVEKSVKTGKEVVLKDVDKDDKKDDEKEVAKEPGFDSFNEFENLVEDRTPNRVIDIDDEDYIEHGEDKPTPEAELNEVLRDAKKAAITEFKDAENKVEAKEAFKDAKDVIKEVKKNTQELMKDNKKPVEDDDDDDKDEDIPLIKNARISEKEALAIALKSKNLNVENIIEKTLTIELDDDNPPAYKINFEYKNGNDIEEYEFVIHAQNGKILEFEMEVIETKKSNSKNDDKNNDKNDDKKEDNNKNNNSNNGKGKNK